MWLRVCLRVRRHSHRPGVVVLQLSCVPTILEKIIRKQQIRQGAHLDGEPRNFEKEIKDMEEQVESVLISGSGSPKRSKKA